MAVQRLSNSGRSGFSYKSLIAGITPLPSVPTIGTANVVSSTSVNVEFTAPGAYAGSTYTATSSPGGLTGTSASSPILVAGLSELTQYTFTVTATNATGTSGASAASSPVTTPETDAGVMIPLGAVTVGSAGASSITFSSIPSTYTHLQIRAFVNSGVAAIRFNSDSGSNYTRHYLQGNGSSVAAGASTSATSMSIVDYGSTANIFTSNIIDILDYANTNKYKTVRNLCGTDVNGAGGTVTLFSGLWLSTSAISTITITGGTAVQYSSFALYGIKGA